MVDKLVTVKMVVGLNYIGHGYHFRKNDTAVLTVPEAKKLLAVKLKNGLKRFTIYDPDLMNDDVVEGSGDITVGDLKPKVTVLDPRRIEEPKKMRKWLRGHGIKVAGNATMSIMLKLIPDNLNAILQAEADGADVPDAVFSDDEYADNDDEETIVDAGSVVGPDSNVDPGEDEVIT